MAVSPFSRCNPVLAILYHIPFFAPRCFRILPLVRYISFFLCSFLCSLSFFLHAFNSVTKQLPFCFACKNVGVTRFARHTRPQFVPLFTLEPFWIISSSSEDERDLVQIHLIITVTREYSVHYYSSVLFVLFILFFFCILCLFICHFIHCGRDEVLLTFVTIDSFLYHLLLHLLFFTLFVFFFVARTAAHRKTKWPPFDATRVRI